jgi:AmmeMemoRadiSam system protein A
VKSALILGGLVFLGICGCVAKERGQLATPIVDVEQVKEEAKVKEHKSGKWSPELTDEEKVTLFAIATDTLEWCVKGSGSKFSFDKYTITEKMKVETATFVTLKISDSLRGCIGSLQPVDALYESVHNNAVLAALRDHRFRPVSESELEKIDIHISILSPIVDIATLDDFNIGEHGIIMSKGPHRAVYLPEVAVEQRWDKDETLSSLSMKAELTADAWKEGAQFQVFSSVGLSKE